MQKIEKISKHRKPLREDDHYAWSPKRCIHCEILIVDKIADVPESIRVPIWHINSGSDVCMLCRAESIVVTKGLDPVKIFDERVDHLLARIFKIAARKLEGDEAVH